MIPRLIATDLDGTLLRSDGTVSERSRRALHAADDAGLPVVFVTGRPPRWLHEVADQTGHRGVVVAANGAVIYDLATETVVREHAMSADDLRGFTATLREAFPEVLFAVEYGLRFGHEPAYRHDWKIVPTEDRSGRTFPEALVGELDEVIAIGGVKLLAKHRGADPDEFRRSADELLAGHATVTHSSSYGLLEISAPGITKASGLADVAAEIGVAAAEVAAIGDMPNDLPMLAWAGRAYAVANAHPAVLEIAYEVLGSNDDDAVAQLVEDVLAQL